MAAWLEDLNLKGYISAFCNDGEVLLKPTAEDLISIGLGSTALSTRHDPEDLCELIGDYDRAVAETVCRFDGFVAKYVGDGVLIHFGYPQPHEDDAEQAVCAAFK